MAAKDPTTNDCGDGHGAHGDHGDHVGPTDAAENLREQRASTRNALHLCLRFLQDRDLQVHARMICAAIAPLHAEHLFSLKMQGNPSDCLLWQAKQAVGDAWMDTIYQIIDTLEDEPVLASLRLSVGAPVVHEHDEDHGDHGDHGDSGDHVFVRDHAFEALVKVEDDTAAQFARMVFELASTRCWSQLHHGMFPNIFACVFHPNAKKAKASMITAKRMFHVLCRAHALRTKVPGVSKALADIATHEHQIVLEACVLSENCGWDYKNKPLRAFLFRVFSGPTNTKTNLEDMFNEIRDHERSNKTRRVSRWRRWWAVMHSKRLFAETVLPTVRLQASDWQVPVVTGVQGSSGVGEGMFVSGKHRPDERIDLGRLGLSPKNTPWRPSGSAANNRAVAAQFLLDMDEPNDFKHVENAWLGPSQRAQACVCVGFVVVCKSLGCLGIASVPNRLPSGCLLGKVGVMFTNTRTNQYYVSLGFCAWSVVAWELTRVESADANDKRVRDPALVVNIKMVGVCALGSAEEAGRSGLAWRRADRQGQSPLPVGSRGSRGIARRSVPRFSSRPATAQWPSSSSPMSVTTMSSAASLARFGRRFHGQVVQCRGSSWNRLVHRCRSCSTRCRSAPP